MTSAQIQFGVKGGVNYNSNSIKETSSDIFDGAKSKTGYHAGIWLRFKLPVVGWYVRPELVYTNLENEVSFENNRADFYIDIIDSRQKILILANAPHPDIAVLKQSISLNKNFDLKIEYANQRVSNLNDYNLVILHQLPSSKFPIK